MVSGSVLIELGIADSSSFIILSMYRLIKSHVIFMVLRLFRSFVIGQMSKELECHVKYETLSFCVAVKRIGGGAETTAVLF